MRAAPFGILSCQSPVPVLGSPAQRDPVPSEPQVVRVVVRRLEDARRQRLAEVGKVEAVTRDELQLPLDGAPHRPSVMSRDGRVVSDW